MFSKACQYAMRAVVCIAESNADGHSMNLKAIARETAMPEAFTAKVLQQLARGGLVLSTKGPGGGFSVPPVLARKVKLSEIVSVIDGDTIYKGCALGLHECDADKPCVLHDHFLMVREELRRMLERTSVQDLVNGRRSTGSVLKRQ